MSATAGTDGHGMPTSATLHPYRRFWATRDLARWEQELAEDVVMHSPLLTTPFVGRDVAVELFGELLEAIANFEFTAEFEAQDAHAFFWRATAGKRTIEGTDLVRLDAEGKVAEITVLIRPLVGLGAFGSALGPRLAARRGRLRGAFVRALNAPLGVMFALVDRVASRLVIRR